jgi:putative oxidoreductase
VTRFSEWRGHAFFALGARLYLAAVFLLACHHKIVDPKAFAVDIATYQILPTVLVNPMAVVLPWVELVAAVLLLLGWRTRAASLLITGMMAMFTIAISMAVAKGLDMSCGCFASQGAVDDPISWRTIVRDGTWLALGIYVIAFDTRPIGLDGWLEHRRRSEERPIANKESG